MTVGEPDPPDLVLGFTAFDSWESAVGRHHLMPMDRLVQRALGDRGVGRVLVADPFRSAPILAARRVLGSRVAFPEAEGRGHVAPGRLLRRDPTDRSGLERTYAAYDRALHQAGRKLGLRSPTVITANPFVAAYSPMEWARSVTYYAWDDWSGYPPQRKWWDAYESAYAEIRRNGRGVCAVSSPLLDRVAPTGPGAVVPNGIEADLWRPQATAPGWMADLPRPILLYTGSIDSRLDMDLLAAAAGAVPEGTVLIIGHVTEPDAVASLASVENVVVHAPVDHGSVPSVVAGCDVGLVPHRRTRLTESMSPLKLYEFLAGGLPVVAVDLVPMRGVDPHVLLVDSPEAFAGAVATSLETGRMSEEVRSAFVEANSWSDRTGRLLEFALQGSAQDTA